MRKGEENKRGKKREKEGERERGREGEGERKRELYSQEHQSLSFDIYLLRNR
jgi:hypothetical protein